MHAFPFNIQHVTFNISGNEFYSSNNRKAQCGEEYIL